jgi:hypothetical protein
VSENISRAIAEPIREGVYAGKLSSERAQEVDQRPALLHAMSLATI